MNQRGRMGENLILPLFCAKIEKREERRHCFEMDYPVILFMRTDLDVGWM